MPPKPGLYQIAQNVKAGVTKASDLSEQTRRKVERILPDVVVPPPPAPKLSRLQRGAVTRNVRLA